MKKKTLIIIIVVAVLLLAGGFGYYFYMVMTADKITTKVSDSSSVIVSNDKLKITKQDYYEYILKNYGSDLVLDEALKEIADKEVTDTDEVDSLVKERMDTYAQYSDGDIEEYATSIGYESAEDYQEQVVEPDVKQELLRKQYIEDNYSDLMSDFNVCSIKKIVVEKESSALSIIKKGTTEEKFDDLMETYDDKAEDCGIVTKNSSSLDSNLLSKLSEFAKMSEDGVYSEAIKLSDDTYAAVFVYDCDEDENKDDYNDTLSSDEDVTTTIQAYYLKKYNFTVNEKIIKDGIKDIDEDYISD